VRHLNLGSLRRFAPQGKRTTRTGKAPVRSPACVIPSTTSSRHPDDRREEGSYSAPPQPWIPSSLRSSGQANDANGKSTRSVACLCHPEHNLLSSSRRPKEGGILQCATSNPGPSAKPASGRQRPPRVRSVAWGPSSLRSSGQANDTNGKASVRSPA